MPGSVVVERRTQNGAWERSSPVVAQTPEGRTTKSHEQRRAAPAMRHKREAHTRPQNQGLTPLCYPDLKAFSSTQREQLGHVAASMRHDNDVRALHSAGARVQRGRRETGCRGDVACMPPVGTSSGGARHRSAGSGSKACAPGRWRVGRGWRWECTGEAVGQWKRSKGENRRTPRTGNATEGA